MDTDTAHRAWNQLWSTPAGREGWIEPEHEVVQLANDLFLRRGARAALDLGCGVGRHALALARIGFSTTAMDLADAGLEQVRLAAEAERLAVTVVPAPMTDLPFADGSFDYVLAFNVIYHGRPEIVATALKEVRRVLRVGGVFQGTMLSKRSRAIQKGKEVAPNTYIWESGEGDQIHPHFFCSGAELNVLMAGFEWLQLADRMDAAFPDYWHWRFAAERSV